MDMLSHERGLKMVLIRNRRLEIKEKGRVKTSSWFKLYCLGRRYNIYRNRKMKEKLVWGDGALHVEKPGRHLETGVRK